MTKLEQEICRILDFKPSQLNTAINEAVKKEKLINTYIFVNGKLSLVKGFRLESNLVYSNLSDLEVDTLECFIPESGLYEIGNNLFSVQRLTHKDWAKSFKPKTYSIQNLSNNTKVDYVELSLAKCELLGLSKKKDLYIFGYPEPIGELDKKDNLKLTVPFFYQEVEDYIKRKGLKWHLSVQ